MINFLNFCCIFIFFLNLIYMIAPICEFLNVPIAYLLTGDESYLTDTEINQKFLTAFSQLNTDNRDIIIGEIKKLLKEQRQEMAQQQTNQNNN